MKSRWCSNDKAQLLHENFRRFISEKGEAQKLMQMGLADFIKNAPVDTNQAAILGGLLSQDGDEDDDKFIVKKGVVTCQNLRPTQNEVVMSKSLEFPLSHAGDFIKYNSSDGPFKVGPPGNDAIITFGGKFVIDGHHRWSALYCCNPNAQLHTFDIQKPGMEPQDVLKAVQAAILANLGAIPANKGGGINLFTVDEATVLKYVQAVLNNNSKSAALLYDYIQKKGVTVAEAAQMGVALVYQPLTQKIIWPNIEILKAKSPPIEDATTRPEMPQTDKVGPVKAGGNTPKALEPLALGQINVSPPYEKVAEERRRSPTSSQISVTQLRRIVKEEVFKYAKVMNEKK